MEACAPRNVFNPLYSKTHDEITYISYCGPEEPGYWTVLLAINLPEIYDGIQDLIPILTALPL